MAGGTLFIKLAVEKGSEAAISQAVQRAGSGAEDQGKKSGGVFGLGFATAAAAGIGKGLQTAASLEQIEVSLTTLTGSAEGARDMLGDLTDFAKATPFEMQGLAENSRALLGVGVAADDVIPTLQTLGDASAALGLNQESMDRVIRAVTQSMAKGKFQAEEMMQMAEAGIPIYGLMADALGTTVPEMQEMAKNGELLAGETLPKLLAVMNQNYAGGMVAQSKTLSGVLSTVKDDINLGLAEAVEDLVPLLTDFLPSASQAAVAGIEVFGNGLSAAATIVGPVVDLLALMARGFAAIPEPIRTAIVAVFLLSRVLGGAGLIGTLIAVTKGLWAARTAIAAAATSAGSFTGGIAAAGSTAARAAGRAGIGALAKSLTGGWWGAAILGIGLLITVISNVADNAANARREMQGFIDSVDFSRQGSVDDALRGLTATMKDYQAQVAGFESQSGILSLWYGDAQLFFRDVDEKADAARDAIKELQESQERYRRNLKDLAGDLGLTAEELERLAVAGDVDLNLLASSDPEDLARFLELLKGSNAAVEAGWDPTSALGEAIATLGDNAATAADKGNALKDALAALAGEKIGVLQATADWQESLAGLAESFQTTNDEGDTVLNDLALKAVNAAGNLNLLTEEGRNIQASVLGAADAMRTSAQAAYEQALATGNAATANEAAGAAAQKARDQFIKQAIDIGLTRQQAEGLANTYGLLPGEVVTNISTPGMTQTQMDLRTVQGQLEGLPPNTPVKVTSLTAEAEKQLQDLGFTVTHMPDGSVQVVANTAQAENDLNWVTRDRTVKATVVVTNTPEVRAIVRLGQVVQEAEGGRLDFLAGGGLRSFGRTLTPMRADWAQVVPANTWRIIGDRARGREWYVPEHAPNSLPVLADAAAAHGLALVRAMADGGMLGGRPVQGVAAGRVTNIRNNLYAAPGLPTVDQLNRMQRRAEVLAGA